VHLAAAAAHSCVLNVFRTHVPATGDEDERESCKILEINFSSDDFGCIDLLTAGGGRKRER
jgi:hypothetical protein